MELTFQSTRSFVIFLLCQNTVMIKHSKNPTFTIENSPVSNTVTVQATIVHRQQVCRTLPQGHILLYKDLDKSHIRFHSNISRSHNSARAVSQLPA